jgi:hypothetical protein
VKLWTALLGKAPTTPKKVEYGTAEMAYAVRRLFDITDVREKNIFAMAAHEGGLVTFGRDLRSAFAKASGATGRIAECGGEVRKKIRNHKG